METPIEINRELIIRSEGSEIDIALLENKQLVEYNRETMENNFAVGDVFYGRVKKILPGLNAAFVDVGASKNAFIHYLDLGEQIRSLLKFSQLAHDGKTAQLNLSSFDLEPDVEKNGKIGDILKVGDFLPVQITKEPIATKGPRISSDISFPGRYLVLVPFDNEIAVSKKIRQREERARLRDILKAIKPKNFGVIIRTVAENKKTEEIEADLRNLLERWNQIATSLVGVNVPTKVVSELDRVSVILRDLLNKTFNSIVVDDQNLYENVRRYIERIDPQQSKILEIYNGSEPIFEHYGVARQVKGLFGRIVTLRNGVYLIVEHTEAMHVIDVNSGHRVNKENTQEENALETNLEAATEIARQLRLRDMGGIVIVDFIDMHTPENRKTLFNHLQAEMAKDRAKHCILPATKFGLIQITRERVRPETEVLVSEGCPVCKGSGKVIPSSVFVDQLEGDVRYLLSEQNEKKITLQVHPFIYAYLTKGFFTNIAKQWGRKYGGKLIVQAINSYNILQFNFLDKNGDDIVFN